MRSIVAVAQDEIINVVPCQNLVYNTQLCAIIFYLLLSIFSFSLSLSLSLHTYIHTHMLTHITIKIVKPICRLILPPNN